MRFEKYELDFAYGAELGLIFALSLLAMTFFVLTSCYDASAQNMTHGIASGDVTDQSAVIWSRADRQALMYVEYDNTSDFSNDPQTRSIVVNKSTDYTGHIILDDLLPDALYFYRIFFLPFLPEPIPLMSPVYETDYGGSEVGRFRTAPSRNSEQNISLIIGGDLGGHEFCRRVDIGYSIFEVMKSLSPDFFIFNGDQIYADHSCPEKASTFKRANFTSWYNEPGGNFSTVVDNHANWNNLTQLRDIYQDHWKYNRADPHLQNFLQSTSLYSQADDHEVINDYGGQWNHYIATDFRDHDGFPNLVRAGIETFFDFSPLERSKDNPNQIYRSFNWGKYLDLFLLDARSYRSPSILPDIPSNNKTLYGKEQLDWLKHSLLNSTAVWKVISSTVPTTVPNCVSIQIGLGCDNWATNTTDMSIVNQTYVSERENFLRFLDEENIENVVFITTDAHFAANVRVEQDFDVDGDMLMFHELISGPLSAALHIPYPKDPTINAEYLYQESGMFNFGHIEIGKSRAEDNNVKAHFTYRVVDANNYVRPGSSLDLIPR